MIEHAIYGLIKNLCNGRVYYVDVPEGTDVPYIAIFKVGSRPYYSLSGNSGLWETRIQVSVFGDTYYQIKQTVDGIKACLDGYRGTSESVSIYSCTQDNEVDMFDDGIYQVNLDYIVLHG